MKIVRRSFTDTSAGTGGRSRLFLALILVQAMHSVEEYALRLYERFPPARFLSGLVSSDLRTGFVVINASIVALGFWCYLFRVRPGHASARSWVMLWIVIELLNGIGHTLWAFSAGAYQPGLATALLLAIVALALLARGFDPVKAAPISLLLLSSLLLAS